MGTIAFPFYLLFELAAVVSRILYGTSGVEVL
jgi:hypothetical protein